jgi:hypothetical protein
VHRTLRCTPNNEQCNDKESPDWLLSASGGIRLSSAPLDRSPEVDVATSRWLDSISDGPVNYSRQRLKLPRVGCSADRALDCPVGGIGPSGATQTSPLSPF